MRVSRSDPSAKSKRITNTAPLRHRFLLEVSSSKVTPRRSRPRTFNGRCTAILRSERCFDTGRLLTWTIGWALLCDPEPPLRIVPLTGAVLKKAFHAFEHFLGCSRRVY